MEWLDDNDAATSDALRARFAAFEKETNAITAKLFEGTRLVKKAVRGPVAAQADVVLRAAGSDGAGAEETWQRGPGGAIIAPID